MTTHNLPGEVGDGSPMFADELEADPHLNRIRWSIMLAIATRCGQVPDVHPRLADGVNAAARLIASETRPLEAEPHWLAEIDRMTPTVVLRQQIRDLVTRETERAYQAGRAEEAANR